MRARQQARARVGRQEVGAEEAAQAALVTRLTDAATTLMSEDADVFDLHREELEHALTVSEMATRRVQPGAGRVPSKRGHACWQVRVQ